MWIGETQVKEGALKVNYVGEIYQGEATGKGKVNYPNGTSYLGTFKNDKWHGFGKLETNETLARQSVSYF